MPIGPVIGAEWPSRPRHGSAGSGGGDEHVHYLQTGNTGRHWLSPSPADQPDLSMRSCGRLPDVTVHRRCRPGILQIAFSVDLAEVTGDGDNQPEMGKSIGLRLESSRFAVVNRAVRTPPARRSPPALGYSRAVVKSAGVLVRVEFRVSYLESDIAKILPPDVSDLFT